MYGAHQRELVAVGDGELPPIGHRGVGAQRHTGGTAVLKEKRHAAADVLYHENKSLDMSFFMNRFQL